MSLHLHAEVAHIDQRAKDRAMAEMIGLGPRDALWLRCLL
jgi:hypothetical protein